MGNIKSFKYWCYKVLPLVYDDSLSYLEVLYKVTDKLNEVIKENNELYEALSEIKPDEIRAEIQRISEELEKVKEGQYIDNYIDALAKWLDKNAIIYFGRMIKLFNVSLEDGHFVLTYPSSWDEFIFDTGVDIKDKETYGHLIIRY